ncbi:MAG TPA: hypothetical protein VH420_08465 [Gaiellaceae bacterium]|jgi:hypothetical protein
MSSAPQAPRAAARTAGAPLTRNRAIAVWSLVIVASLLLLVSSLTIWVKRQALDTDAWTNTSGQMLANDQIREQLSIYLVDTLFTSTNATQRIQDALPQDRAALAPLISGALRNFAVQAADRLLATPQAQELWERANRLAHENLLAVLNGEDVGRFQTANGSVVLDLSPVVQQLKGRLGLTGERLDPNAGRITILTSDQLSTAQTSLKAIKVLSVFLVFLVLFLYALAIYLAAGHRRKVLRASAASFVIVGVILLAVQRIVGNQVVNSLVSTDAVRPATHNAWIIGTELLRGVAVALIAYGLIVLAGAWFAGPSRWATAGRERLAPVLHEQAWAVYASVAAVFLLVLAWGPTQSTKTWFGILLLGSLLFFGVAMLHRQTVAEFPETKSA